MVNGPLENNFLDTELLVRYPNWELDISLRMQPGETWGLLGPNGAGKSTVVSALSGLNEPDHGFIRLGEETWFDGASAIWYPPEQRSVGVMFQDGLLFPHLNIAQNLGYGLRSRGISRSDVARQVSRWLEKLEVSYVSHHRPHQVSGGQAQRVALGRALIGEPDLLLLDEPLSALDMAARPQFRRLLSEHLAEFPGPRLLITHDPAEAFLLSHQLAILEEGRITQTGTPQQIRLNPCTEYAANLVGVNRWPGTVSQGSVQIGEHRLQVPEYPWQGPGLISVHPRAVTLHAEPPEGSAQNNWTAEVQHIAEVGAGDRLRVELGPSFPLVAEITRQAREQLRMQPGSQVWVSVKATEISVQPY